MFSSTTSLSGSLPLSVADYWIVRETSIMTLTEEEEISRWDELLKDRYTENDLFYTEHLAKIRKGPPVIEQWSRSRGR